MEHIDYQLSEVRLHVVEAGPKDGEVILFLHGFPEFWYAWKKQIEYFSQKGYRVIAPDQRGYNLSDKPDGVDAYKGEILAKDMQELIELLEVEKVYLVGHDWGGFVAWYLTILYPELIKKLVILNVPHPYILAKTLSKSWKQRMKSWYAAMFQLPLLPEAIVSLGNYFIAQNMMRNSANPGTFTDEMMQEYVKAWSQKGAFSAMINWYRAVSRTDKKLISREAIQNPTLMIWGEQDQFLGTEMAQPSIELCPNGQLKTFPDATHWIAHEKSTEVSQLIESFIQKP